MRPVVDTTNPVDERGYFNWFDVNIAWRIAKRRLTFFHGR